MLAQPCPSTAFDARPQPRLHGRFVALLLAFVLLAGCSSTQVRTAKDAAGKPVALSGTVVLIEPDIELSELGAGGMAEPRKEWSNTARLLYPQAARETLAAQGIGMAPDFVLPADTGPDNRLRLHRTPPAGRHRARHWPPSCAAIAGLNGGR